MAIRHILLRLADFVVIRTLQCWNLRRIICSSCLNLTTRRCVRVSKLSTTWGKVKSIFVFWKPLFKEIYFSFLRYHFFSRFCFMQKNCGFCPVLVHYIAQSMNVQTLKKWKQLNDMAYTFFARVKDFIMIILPICFSDERDKCKMKPGNNVFGCPP